MIQENSEQKNYSQQINSIMSLFLVQYKQPNEANVLINQNNLFLLDMMDRIQFRCNNYQLIVIGGRFGNIVEESNINVEALNKVLQNKMM